jgi:transposase-like protein
MIEPTSAQDLFKGRHFDHQIIILCVRWYLTFKLSSRDLVQMMAERGIILVHTTILRWVQRYVPEFEKRWSRYALPVGDSWRVDETYLKVRGQWVYLYRAVDKAGRTVDFLLSKTRDIAAAKRFFSRATRQHGVPRVITLEGYAASHRAVAKLKAVGTEAGANRRPPRATAEVSANGCRRTLPVRPVLLLPRNRPSRSSESAASGQSFWPPFLPSEVRVNWKTYSATSSGGPY